MVQKEVLEAGLGKVHVVQVDSAGESQAGNLGNKRPATVRVQIRAIAVGGVHLPDAGKSPKTLQQFRGVLAEAQAQHKRGIQKMAIYDQPVNARSRKKDAPPPPEK